LFSEYDVLWQDDTPCRIMSNTMFLMTCGVFPDVYLENFDIKRTTST